MSDFAFDSWMTAVDAEVERLCCLSVHDLADQPFRDWFDSGMTAEEAARQTLVEEGFLEE
jgi:hypothetical protein